MPLPSTMTPIATLTLSSASTSVTFTNIPQGYTDLVLVCGNLGMSAGGSAGRLRFNSDTGSNYSGTWLYGTGTTAGSSRDSSQTSMRIIGANIGPSGSNINDNYIFSIQNYSNSTTYKTVVGRGSSPSNEVYSIVGLWRSNSAVTSITIVSYNGTDTFRVDSNFTIYGVKAA
jgi:hypothetical protein